MASPGWLWCGKGYFRFHASVLRFLDASAFDVSVFLAIVAGAVAVTASVWCVSSGAAKTRLVTVFWLRVCVALVLLFAPLPAEHLVYV